jgi:hypothetical protein
MTSLPLPNTDRFTVAAAAPGPGPQNWAGAPGAALDADGSIVVGYRVRYAEPLGDEVVIGRLAGERLEPVVVLSRAQFRAAMLERPAVVRTETGAWRVYVGCATPNSKHWRIDVVEAPTLDELPSAAPRTAFPGDDATGVKDPVVRRGPDGWHAWICCHLLDVPGEEDRMETAYATSDDGLDWRWHGTVLRGREGAWDARGARVTAVLPGGWFAYDGRRTAEENWWERTGLARATGDGRLEAEDGDPVAAVRYLDVLALPGGGHRLFYEAALEDESHELRTELIPRGAA